MQINREWLLRFLESTETYLPKGREVVNGGEYDEHITPASGHLTMTHGTNFFPKSEGGNCGFNIHRPELDHIK